MVLLFVNIALGCRRKVGVCQESPLLGLNGSPESWNESPCVQSCSDLAATNDRDE